MSSLEGKCVGASGRHPRSHEFSEAVMLTYRGLDYIHIFGKVVVNSSKCCYVG